MPQIKNQEVGDLSQIALWYKVSKEKLEDLIEVKDKSILTRVFSPELSKSKLVGVEELRNLNPNFF